MLNLQSNIKLFNMFEFHSDKEQYINMVCNLIKKTFDINDKSNDEILELIYVVLYMQRTLLQCINDKKTEQQRLEERQQRHEARQQRHEARQQRREARRQLNEERRQKARVVRDLLRTLFLNDHDIEELRLSSSRTNISDNETIDSDIDPRSDEIIDPRDEKFYNKFGIHNEEEIRLQE